MGRSSSGNKPDKDKLNAVLVDAAKCRKCFSSKLANPGGMKIAQVPWVGGALAGNSIRVALLLSSCPKNSDAEAISTMEKFGDGKVSLAVLQKTMTELSSPFSKCFSFLEKIGIKPVEAAITSVGMCSVGSERAPRPMLRNCFQLFTGQFLTAINPEAVVLVGSDANDGFRSQVVDLLPRSEVISVPHLSRIDSETTAKLRSEFA